MDKIERAVERRGIRRLAIQIKFQYQLQSSSEVALAMRSSITKNINYAGLLFENEEQIPIDTKLKVILNMPGVPRKNIELEGRVTRVEKLSPSVFDIGIYFLGLSEAQKEEIKRRIERMDTISLLDKVKSKEFSDLHLTVNSPPMVRRFGKLAPLETEILTAEEIKNMIYSILTEGQKKHFEANKDLDFSFSPSPDSRFRVSIYQQRGTTEVVFRNILPYIHNIKELGLPDIVSDLCELRDGIVIIGGTTGSGKSTTIAAMIDVINKSKGGVILSLEKPIEYMHRNIKAIVKQREIGVDVSSYAAGLKAALRQDADVIIVGEILDAETIETAIAAAETGHLVITSLHSTDTVQVFDRIMSFFPAEQRHYICARLAHSLRAVILQSLLPHKSGTRRVLATEVCTVNTAVKRTINNEDFRQLDSIIQTSSQYKMHLMQKSLDMLFEGSLISSETYEVYTKKLVKK